MSNINMREKLYKYIMLYILICISVILTACQATPTKPVIAGNKASLEEMALQTADIAEPKQTGERIVWNESKTVNTEIGECSINASINADMPARPGNVPVYLIEPKEMNIDFLKSAAEYLMRGKIYDGEKSKQDIMMEIMDIKKQLNEHGVSETENSNAVRLLDSLYNRYEKAPENNAEPEYDFKEQDLGQVGFRLKCYPTENSIADFQAMIDETGKCHQIYFRENEINTVFNNINNKSDNSNQAKGTNMTFNEAQTLAEKALKTLFNAPYAMVRAWIINKINVYESMCIQNDGHAQSTSLGQAYIFYYTREYDVIPSLYINPASIYMTEDNAQYAKPYIREYAQIIVDDRGIVNMTYFSLSGDVKRLNDNVKILPFNDVLEQFKRDVFIHNLWGNSADITITKIEFGMVREPVKDNPDQYMMVPALNFIGNITTKSKGQQTGALQEDKSILAYNVIDGSIITDYESMYDPR